MNAQLYVGCPMWANRGWVGTHFPSSTRVGDELGQYAQWCNAVEGNTTFYASPSSEIVRRWRDSTPESFRFMFKLPQVITHERRLRGTDAEVTAFVRLMEPLGERVGSISIQLPPTFGPGDLGVLAAFLRRTPRRDSHSVRWSVEVRHRQFFDGGRAQQSLDRLLADVGAERVILDTRTLFSRPPTDDAERHTWTQKPQLPVLTEALSDRPVVRFVGRSDDSETVAGWQPWLPIVARWIGEGRQPTFFLHTPDNSSGLTLARRFHDEVAGLRPEVDRLSAPSAVGATLVQASLFDGWGDP